MKYKISLLIFIRRAKCYQAPHGAHGVPHALGKFYLFE